MSKRQEILEYIKKNQTSNINIINFIENYPIDYIERIGDSVIVKGTSDRSWVYISSNSRDELQTVKSKLDSDDKCFAIIEDWMMPILTEDCNIRWKLSTMRLILDKRSTFEIGESLSDETTEKLSELSPKDAEFIYENSDYKDFLSIEYIIDRITNGESSCIRNFDKLIAWAITQDDGAIGFLHVLPEHRKKGYGREVTMDLINKVIEKNKIPFAHIEEDNISSMNLVTSLGFKKDKIVNWFEIE